MWNATDAFCELESVGTVGAGVGGASVGTGVGAAPPRKSPLPLLPPQPVRMATIANSTIVNEALCDVTNVKSIL